MPQLIKNRAVVDDRWTLLREAAGLSDLAADTAQIVPLAFWLAHRDALKARGDIGVWLAPVDDPATLAADVPDVIVRLVDVYVENRHEDERFIETVRRIGIVPFKERVYAAAH